MNTVQIEQQILRVICQGFTDGPIAPSALARLENYRWSSASHEAIFRALWPMRGRPAELIRKQLPARLTRAGFPDLYWEDLFEPHGLSREEAGQLLGDSF
ncbi:MAG: hypothetical protein KGM47_17195 [Acidobacteriota bacterium]|nr:hypothetical protein [Acidobacteriota bacterium]